MLHGKAFCNVNLRLYPCIKDFPSSKMGVQYPAWKGALKTQD